MAGLKDFLFGSGTLKKAAGNDHDADDKKAPQSAGLDMGKLAQDTADRAKSTPSLPQPSQTGKSPLSTTMTPLPKKAGK